ncbi:hypothetical protein ACFQ4N_09460 [Oceanobacillus iheyensis]|uniref:hypothetical protein n=1 Tax=Oceanobacillus iheyensis TaxID=182710 RepID=UPI003639F173
MTQISKEHLEFVEEAKKEFNSNPLLETYRNGDDSLIALRMGKDRDCVMVYKLNGCVANFIQQLNPTKREVFSFESKHSRLRI